jgi:hypothetical protein
MIGIESFASGITHGMLAHAHVAIEEEGTEVREIFLSATVRDLDHERYPCRGLARSSLERAEIAVFVQEHWATPFADVVDECRRRVTACNGYLALLGYRYGWVPNGQERSITHLEFETACERWNRLSRPPMWVFLPERESEAAHELELVANTVLREEFGDDEAQCAASKQRQATFRDEIASRRRIFQTFKNLVELGQRVGTAVLLYNNRIGRSAPEHGLPARARIPDGELGAIGRGEQIAALKRLRRQFVVSSEPGICFVVHGGELSGQQELLEHLAGSVWWKSGKPPALGRAFSDDLQALGEWMASEIGKNLGEPSNLAVLLARACEDRPLVFLVRSLGAASLEKFHGGFWLPLQHSLRSGVAAGRKLAGVILVVAHYEPLNEPPPAFVQTAGPEPELSNIDCSRLVALPCCRDMEEADIAEWLEDLDVADERANAVAQSVVRLKNDQTDGTPVHVFRRILEELYDWNEIVEGQQ